jgi:hypothetical protein
MMKMLMARRALFGLVILMIGLLVIVAETATSATPVQAVTADQSPTPAKAQHTLPVAIALQELDSFILASAGNSCDTAALLEFPPGGTGTGANTPVGQLTQDADDPVLSCMWGNPLDPRGYRTAWYQFSVPRNGQVTISTFGSNYDTVLAVYEGSCGQLQKLACNDDYNMLSSQVTLSVRTGQTYYIQVADWEASNPGGKNLELSVVLDPIESDWEQMNSLVEARTRHVGLTAGPYLYVIGGFNDFGGPDNYVASTRVDRLHTPSGHWSSMASVPAGGANQIGYFNSSGVHVNGRIYIPAGDDGSPTFVGQHWALDIGQNLWLGPSDGLASINWAAWADDGLPVGFAAATAVGGSYYLTGGTSDTQRPLNNKQNSKAYNFHYDTVANSWQQRADMQISRYAHAAAWVGGRLCVAGGIHNNNDGIPVLQPSAECYDPNTNSWSFIPDMLISRYGAGSAVGPNGRWYIFGGVKGDGATTPEIEVYDPATGRWHLLGARADLGGTLESPARTWPRGGFVGNYLWVAGGNLIVNNGEIGVLPQVERLYVAPRQLYLPFMQGPPPNPTAVNNTFAQSAFLPFNQAVFSNFATPLDYYDVFNFGLTSQRLTTIDLTNIPADHDYDLLLYNNNKTLLAASRNLAGQNEQIVRNLGPGRYYVVVERVLPTAPPDPYVHYRLLLR